MNRLFAFILILSLGACTADTPTNTQGSIVPSKTATDKPMKIVEASVLAPLIGSWEATHALNFKNSEDRKKYEGIWFDLKGDQTFVHGQYEAETHTGTYTFDDKTQIIEFVFNPSGQQIANQYKIQGIGFKGTSTLIWMGNTPKNPDGMQIKMVKFNRAPAQ